MNKIKAIMISMAINTNVKAGIVSFFNLFFRTGNPWIEFLDLNSVIHSGYRLGANGLRFIAQI